MEPPCCQNSTGSGNASGQVARHARQRWLHGYCAHMIVFLGIPLGTGPRAGMAPTGKASKMGALMARTTLAGMDAADR
jgi:hypothetical protein